MKGRFEQFSYSSSNWVVKQHRQLLTSTTNAFGLGTAKERTAQQWFKKFCKGDKSLEDEVYSGQPWEVGNDQLRTSSKLILLQLHRKLPKNSSLTVLWSFSI